MKLRMILASTAVAGLAAAPAASAQVGGGTDVTARVPSFLELILTQPSKGFAAFKKTRSYQMSFKAQVTATDAPTLLTLADGDATGGSKLGHISVGKKRLPSPLEARVGKSKFQSLDDKVDPLLTRWSDVQTREETTVRLRQKVKGKATGNYRKVLLVTLSTETP
jgi:hypothetical protein